MDSLRTRAHALVATLDDMVELARLERSFTVQQVNQTFHKASARARRMELALERALKDPVSPPPRPAELAPVLRLLYEVEGLLASLPAAPEPVRDSLATRLDQALQFARHHAEWLRRAIEGIQGRTAIQPNPAQIDLRRISLLFKLLSKPRHSLSLAVLIVQPWLRLLPATYRQRYADEWLGELEWAKTEREPLLGLAITIAMHTPRLAVGLHCRIRYPQATAARWWRGLELAKASCGAAATFLAIAVGMWAKGATPTRTEILLALLASLLGGMVTGWPARQRSDEHNNP